MEYREVLLVGASTLMLTVCIWGSFYFLTKPNYRNAPILVTILLLVLLNASYIQFSLLKELVKFRITLVIVVLILIRIGWYIRKTNSSFDKINTYFNLVLIVCICWLGWKWISWPKHIIQNVNTEPSKNTKTDVYLLVIDGYASPHNLKKYWHYSNNIFQNFLKKEAFHVVENAHSNYNMTQRTLGSMLNLDYIVNLEEPRSTEYLLKEIPNNKSTQLFKKQNYQIGWFSLLQEYESDYREGTTIIPLSYVQYAVIRSFIFFIPSINDFLFPKNEPKLIRYKILLKKYDNFLKFIHGNSTKPKFGYYHSFYSHGPFIVDSTGFNMNMPHINPMNAYEKSLRFNENTIMTLIKEIKAANSKAIILVMSDHGYRDLSTIPKKEARKEGFENFMAVYLPDHNYTNWYDGMTPINAWRNVVNAALGTNLPRLPDRTELE
ncbi:MAG: sulfatase-like hydrolase/transferase [Siphonobacter sp.]